MLFLLLFSSFYVLGFRGFKCTDDKHDTILKEIDGNLVKNDIKSDNKKIGPFGIDQVMLNVFGDLKGVYYCLLILIIRNN